MTVTTALVLVVSGCGESSTENGQSETAESWPPDEITIIVPREPGGGQDTHARGIAPFLAEELGVDVSIENVPGASGQVGTEQFLERGSGDGSLLLAHGEITHSSTDLVQGADYDAREFPFVNFNQVDPMVIAVNAESEWESLDALVADMKERPGEISIASNSTGILRLGSTLFQQTFEVTGNEVFFDGGSDLLNAILGGHADVVVHTSSTMSTIQDEARVLAVAEESSHSSFELWEDAVPINEAASGMGYEEMPLVPSARFIAAHPDFPVKNPEGFDQLTDALKSVVDENDGYRQSLEEGGAVGIVNWWGPELSQERQLEMYGIVEEYQDQLAGD